MSAELLARNPTSVGEATTALSHKNVVGDTTETAATIGLVKWRAFATQNEPRAFYTSPDLGRGIEDAAVAFKKWYVYPIFHYLDEMLGDFNLISSMLTR